VFPAPGVVGADNFAAKDIEYPAAVLHELDLPAADRERMVNGNAKRVLHLAQQREVTGTFTEIRRKAVESRHDRVSTIAKMIRLHM